MTKTAAAKSWALHVWSDGSNRSYPEPAAQASVVQWAQKDPKPGNLDAYFNGASTSGTPHFGLSQAGYYAADTTNGNTLLCMATIATDAHNTPPSTGNQIFSVQDPVNGAWDLIGALDNITDCNCEIKVYAKFNAAPLLTTSWTGTGAVSGGGVLAIGSGTGPFRLGQRINSSHTPTVDHSGNETAIVSLLSGTLGASGSTYQLGNTAMTPFASEAMTTTDFVSQTRSQIFTFTDYPGLFLAEINGTDGVNAYFSGHNDAPTGSGTDTVTSGALSSPSVPGLVFGFGFNGGINNGAAGAVAPAAGTGFSTSHGILTYDEQTWTGPICTAEWKHVANINGVATTFSPNHASDYATVAVAFPDHA